MRTVNSSFKTMAADGLTITEQWIREKLNFQHCCLADVRSLTLPGTYEWKIYHLGTSLKNFVRLKSLDLSHNALVTVKGIEHLELLERLNLYFNRLASLQDVFSLHKLQNLQELDLRLNPVVKKHPQYRLFLIHAITSLRKLDDCPVRDRERKAALMHFSTEANLDTNKKPILTQDTTGRSSDLRIKAMQKMVKTLSLLEGNEEAALNDVSSKTWNRKRLEENPSESDVIHLINDSDGQWPSKQKQVSFASKSLDYKTEAAVGSHRVTFVSPVAESRRSHVRGESVFTPHPTVSQPTVQAPKWEIQLEDRANPVLHPPRLTTRSTGSSERSPSVSKGKRKTLKGAYRKPMELLLSMMEDLWSEKKENEQNRTFLMKMVEILRMMEQDVERGEQEVQTLKETLEASNARTERQEKQQQSEIEELTLQLQQAHETINGQNEQLKSVLEENVSLQKQLIRAQHELLETRVKTTAVQDRGVQSIPEDLNDRKHNIQEGNAANEQQESYRSLITRNERLLQQLEEALLRK